MPETTAATEKQEFPLTPILTVFLIIAGVSVFFDYRIKSSEQSAIDLRGGIDKLSERDSAQHAKSTADIATILQKFAEVETQFHGRDDKAATVIRELERRIEIIEKSNADRGDQWIPEIVEHREKIRQLQESRKP